MEGMARKLPIAYLPSIKLGYAPPYSTAIDIAAHAVNVLRNKIDGIARSLTPREVKEMAGRGNDFLWLDVRSPEEHKQTRIEDPRVKLVPPRNLAMADPGNSQRQKNPHPVQGRPARLRGDDDSGGGRFQGCTDHGWRIRGMAVRKVRGEEVTLHAGWMSFTIRRAARCAMKVVETADLCHISKPLQRRDSQNIKRQVGLAPSVISSTDSSAEGCFGDYGLLVEMFNLDSIYEKHIETISGGSKTEDI
jgi:hypothetical protein